MALNLLPDQPAERRLPEPFYVAKCRNELMHHAKDHPELTLLLEALEEVGRFSARMRELYLQAEHGAVRAVLNGRYGLSNSCEDACSDISATGRKGLAGSLARLSAGMQRFDGKVAEEGRR